LDYWQVPDASAEELLIRFDNHPIGLLRLVKYHGVEQEYARSSQKPCDTGGIMDINLRVHSVKDSFNELREMGWHGLSNPLFQTMDSFLTKRVLIALVVGLLSISFVISFFIKEGLVAG